MRSAETSSIPVSLLSHRLSSLISSMLYCPCGEGAMLIAAVLVSKLDLAAEEGLGKPLRAPERRVQASSDERKAKIGSSSEMIGFPASCRKVFVQDLLFG